MVGLSFIEDSLMTFGSGRSDIKVRCTDLFMRRNKRELLIVKILRNNALTSV